MAFYLCTHDNPLYVITHQMRWTYHHGNRIIVVSSF